MITRDAALRRVLSYERDRAIERWTKATHHTCQCNGYVLSALANPDYEGRGAVGLLIKGKLILIDPLAWGDIDLARHRPPQFGKDVEFQDFGQTLLIGYIDEQGVDSIAEFTINDGLRSIACVDVYEDTRHQAEHASEY